MINSAENKETFYDVHANFILSHTNLSINE
jgi:hypothetical protein